MTTQLSISGSNGYIRLAGSTDSNVDDALLQELTQMWEPHQRQGLEVRHRTGALLNAKFGDSGNRQKYGAATLKRYAATLGLAESELSRMRRFASTFGSVSDLQTQHPDVITWSQVKTVLAKPRDPGEVASKRPAAGITPKCTASSAIRAIRSLRKQVGGLELLPTDPAWKKLHKAVSDMIATASKCLGVAIVTLDTTAPVEDRPARKAPRGSIEQA